MNSDVTITISTGGDGTINMAAPGPNPTDVAHAERLDGAPRGPIPTPLDQLPKVASGAVGDASTADGGLPIPMEIANLAAFAANAGGQPPPPVDLDRLGPPARSSAARKPATRKPAARKPK
jgi:NAD(P)-dependent dehydrogenase (short-subunit alcohol dehydrogenase family)